MKSSRTLWQHVSVYSIVGFVLAVLSLIAPSSAFAGPDLSVENFSVTGGTVLRMVERVRNNGNAPAGATAVTFYASTDGTLDAGDVVVCTRTVASVAAGAYDPASGTATTDCTNSTVAPGVYTIIAKVDVADVVSESNEANNTKVVVGIAIGPDLSVENFSVTGTGKLSISSRARNRGNATAAASEMSFYLSADAAYQAGTDQSLVDLAGNPCKRGVGGVAAGGYDPASGTVSTTCYVPGNVAPGFYYFIAFVDSGSVVTETDEGNNIAVYGTVSVGPGTFIESINPNCGKVGDVVKIFGTGFGSTKGTSTVTFNGITATNTLFWSETGTEIHVQVPVGATTGPVRVIRNGGSNAVTFTVSDTCTLSGPADYDIVAVHAPGSMLVGEAQYLDIFVKNINAGSAPGFGYSITGITTGTAEVVLNGSGSGNAALGETVKIGVLFTAPNKPGQCVDFTVLLTDQDPDLDEAVMRTCLEPDYLFAGFLPPVTINGKAFKIGSTIPVKFRLIDRETGA
ncbi:MAG TPA: CARDB domain-containing protein, partial [Nitrospiria bacterium]|nr:CARDB domain-containing protein [Nitrospiria bacterium]